MNIDTKRILLIIIFIALFLRILFVFLFADLRLENYWEFGIIAENLKLGRGYSLFYFTGNHIAQIIDLNVKPYPSAFMPPLYVYFIYPFIYIDSVVFRNILLIGLQIIISIITIILIFNFCKRYFSLNTAIISAILIAIVPEFIYITTIFNAVTHYHLLVLCLLMIIMSDNIFDNTKYLLLFSVLCSLLLLLRSEIVLFIFFILAVFLVKKKFKFVLKSVILICIIISPWAIRNYIIFNEFIPLSTSGGLNFYRGHNPQRIGYWGDESYLAELHSMSNDTNFEILYNRYFLDRGIESIKENPGMETLNIFVKIFHLWVFNPEDKRSFNPAYLIPSLLILAFSILGIIKSFNIQKYKFLYLFLLSTTLISIIFFALPRYQIMMKICLIPFCAFYFDYIFNLLRTKFFKSSK